MFIWTRPQPATVCLLLAIGLDQPLAPATPLPFESPRGNLIAVRATIGPEPVRVFLDTGTARSIIDRRLARKLSLRGTPDSINVFGHTVRAERVTLPALALGPIRAAGLSVLVTDLSGLGARLGSELDAIVGLDALRGNCLVVDYPRRTLHFGCTDGWTASAACDARSPYMVTAATIDGREYRLLVDTGADALSLVAGVAARHPVNGSVQIVAADTLERTVHLRIFTADSVRIGGTDLGRQPVVITPGGEGLGYDGLLATRQLGHRVQLDVERLVISWQR